MRLRDGRRLAYAEFGDPGGRPAFYFHGFPGSRKEGALIDRPARARGVRVIAIDRPGYGASDPCPERSLLDWAGDVSDLADSLAVDRFLAIGASGGGPYVAACARRLPDRLAGAGILCGMGPTDDPSLARDMMALYRVGLRGARRVPSIAHPVFALVGPAIRRWPAYFVRRIAAGATAPDRAFFRDPECTALFLSTFREAFRNGTHGAVRDAQLYARPWGFRLEEIRATVHLWHGELDNVVPVAFGRHVASRIPRCRATFFADEGHFSIATRRADEIVAAFDDT